MLSLLSRAPIRQKLVYLLAMPIIGLLAFSGLSTVESYLAADRMAKVSTLAELAPDISAVVHELQKERGRSAGFIGSGGKKFATELPEQRKTTDTQHRRLTSALAAIGARPYGTRKRASRRTTAIRKSASPRSVWPVKRASNSPVSSTTCIALPGGRASAR